MSISRALVSFAAFSLLACSGASSSDTGGSGAATGDEQDVVSGKGVYRVVGAGLTGGSAVRLVNRTTTKCSDGKSQGSCTIVKLDSSGLKLDSDTADQLEKAFFAGHALVQGSLTTETTKDPGSFQLPILKANAAWIGAAGKDPGQSDSVYRVTKRILNGFCTGPCGELNEALVNSTKAASEISTMDLSGSGAKKPDLDSADAETQIGAEGLLIVGINHSLVHGTVGQGVETQTTLVATDFYLPVKANGSACGGIAGLSCGSGFICDMGPGKPVPDQSGTCVKAQSCGGIAGLACPSGFACDLGAHPIPDQTGTCARSN